MCHFHPLRMVEGAICCVYKLTPFVFCVIQAFALSTQVLKSCYRSDLLMAVIKQITFCILEKILTYQDRQN